MTVKITRANIISVIAGVIVAILAILFLSGCFYGHAEYGQASVTVITVGKSITIDPNGYHSDTDSVSVWWLPVMVRTE